MALYGYEPPKFSDLLLEDSRVPTMADFVQQHLDILKSMRENLQQAQNQQKKYVDQNRTKRRFDVDDMVYSRLQPYQQKTLKKSGAKKVATTFLWTL